MTNKKRQPKGIPVGGQFAHDARGESLTSLVADPFEFAVERIADGAGEADIRAEIGDTAYDSLDAERVADAVDSLLTQRAVDAVDQAWDPQAYAERTQEDALRETLSAAYASARLLNQRRGVQELSRGTVDADDLAQEGHLAVLQAKKNGVQVENTAAYAHRAIWAVAGRGDGTLRSEDRRALRMLAERRAELAASTGRALSAAEIEVVAKDIYDNWHDPRRKPSANFHTMQGRLTQSLEQRLDGGFQIASEGDLMDDNDRVIEPGSFMDRALAATEGHGGDNRDARRMMWNALAEMSGSPMVEAGSLSQRKITEARAVMKQYADGVEGALSKWEDGVTDAQTEAFFAPWGTDDAGVRDAVVSQMRRFNDKAEDMWVSALRLSNTRNVDS